MRTTTIKRSVGLATLAAALLASASAHAADPAYVGTWASDLGQCKVAQERQEAPLVLSKDGYDQHETHCKFKSVDGADGEWKVKSDCTVEGNAEPYDFTLTVSGDTLTVTDEAGSRDLLACK
ncbi:hypothetical protein [Hyphomicrobium sp. LHD-15]|uniref:hypothetical protein n=1 Tax=Hyphomicrobium sp. LHD-15 TaxID=3072142 RepID=UPI00280D6867|nr:hypothetical protein [Hyphomicrobium sp. LHD-15]MDQ8700519.1 hypothetical protein [Hyphomicrobium sp. LHD-15]